MQKGLGTFGKWPQILYVDQIVSNVINSEGKVFFNFDVIHYNGPISATKSFKYDTSPHNFTGYLHLPALVGFFAIFYVRPSQRFGSNF